MSHPHNLLTMQRPFFTIITASYNNGSTIQNTISSIKKQTFKNYEHIVVDGGSTDQTLSILHDNSDQYSLKYISEKDEGIGDAMNKGVKISKGEYILFIHADDQLAHNDTLQDVFNDISISHNKMYAYSICYDSISPHNEARPISTPYWYKFRNTIPHQGAFVHRVLFRNFGEFDTSLSISMDYEFFYKILLAREPVHYSNRIVSIMGTNGISSCPSNYRNRLKQEFRIQKSLEKSIIWKIIQKTFQPPYFIYKVYVSHIIGSILHPNEKTAVR
ncbi:glycosyltransferase family 2 protein [Desulfoluna spongiiphila]|uniref:glycosyltransferase family 2 protein n=1 Tax=Desulfoluna spongiiphila TaxID=419481 RepID=UPI001252E8E7|nr:glycosyltransferase family 2 protein [Desulfoluna spongiiphila]VVS90857.1 nucleotide-diphospho-sugar transferases [Desulfoluna spongiiphila]